MSNLTNSGVIIGSGPDDPRLYDADDEFGEVLVKLSPMTLMSKIERRRFLHPTGTTVEGTLHVLDAPDIPAHEFLHPGRRFRLIGRYSNAMATDDITPSLRGLSLRFLDPATENLADGLLDLQVNTGQCFHGATASIFARINGTPDEREAVFGERPHLHRTMWSAFRAAVSYPSYYYHSQVPRGFVSADGQAWLVRYRVIPANADPADGSSGPGGYDPGDLWMPPDPPDELPRPTGDSRPATFLHDDLRARASTGGIQARLQVQLRPVVDSAPDNELALDCSLPWPADRYPWRDLARIHFDRLVDNALVEGLRFNVALAPANLGIALARSPHEAASVNHLRALVYHLTSAARLGQAPRPELQDLLRRAKAAARARSSFPVAPRPRTVCIVGAGPTGLTIARELERAGHRAIVLESNDEVGGKCASVDIDGRAYDLGGHLCTTQYERLARLAVEVGVATEDTTPHLIYDADDGSAAPQSAAFFRRETFRRYAALRAEQFPRIAEPGLGHSAKALSAPVSKWLAEHGLEAMAESLGTGYTSAGYGYLDDDVPALYFVKYAEMTGLLSTKAELLGHAHSFTIVGGFMNLWLRVADQLSDVRCGVRIQQIERDGDGVRVRTDRGVVEADDLVLTIPLDQLIDVIDASPEESAVAARIRNIDYHTTVCSASGLPRSAFYLVRQHAADPGMAGHAVAFHHRYPGSDDYVCYSYGSNDHGTAGVATTLRDDLTRFGGELGTLHIQRQWAFMPHFSSHDLQAGIFDQIEELQGHRNTYHAGSLLAFELVECNMGYAQELVERFFPRTGGAPAPVSTPARRDEPAADAVARPSTVSPVATEELRDWLIEQLAAELQLPEEAIDPAAPLETFGLDSLAVAALQAELSDKLGYRLPHTLFLELPTIDAVARHLTESDGPSDPDESQDDDRGGRSSSATASLVLGLAPARPFFCLGGVVGAAYYLRPLARATGHEPFYGVQAPGLDGAEAPPQSIEDLAARYVHEIRKIQPHGPYRVGGHSFGGLVAYEVGRKLRAAGAEVAQVILLDTYVARDGQPKPPADEVAAIAELAAMNRLIYGTANGPANGCARDIDPTRPVADQLEELGRVLGASGALPVGQHIANLVRVYQTNLEAIVDYQPLPSDLPVTLIKATGGFPQVMRPGREVHSFTDAPLRGWEYLDLPNLRVIEVPGDHFTVFAEPHLGTLAAALRDCLEEQHTTV